MIIQVATQDHFEAWLRMRASLWADAPIAEHQREIKGMMTAQAGQTLALLAILDGAAAAGFAEASLRRDHVNGCETSPVAFLEGLYVDPDHRRRGVARLLLNAVEAWGRSVGCAELASDSDWRSLDGQAFHAAAGFQETERVIFFKKRL